LFALEQAVGVVFGMPLGGVTEAGVLALNVIGFSAAPPLRDCPLKTTLIAVPPPIGVHEYNPAIAFAEEPGRIYMPSLGASPVAYVKLYISPCVLPVQGLVDGVNVVN